MSKIPKDIVKYAKKVRLLVILLGAPTLMIVGAYLYERQIENLKSENEILKQTQYDKALVLIKSQKELFNNEIIEGVFIR